MQLLLYTPDTSPRLQYICHFIFKEIMLVDCLLTTDHSVFQTYEGIKVKYANEAISNDHLTIGTVGLLFENDIRQQALRCFETGKYTAFFRTGNADLPFDILAASFYLLSRYEEYLPHTTDLYGRYAHENSLAFQENFLHLPLINIWAADLAEMLQRKFPAFTIQHPSFAFLPTYDIDMAFSYKHKGLLRNAGGFLKNPSITRLTVLSGLRKDPFDAYDWLNALHTRYDLQPLYFFLLAEENGIFDKNILPRKKVMQKLIQQHAARYIIGIHPSWQSGDHQPLLSKEIKQLETITQTKISRSRQHYIRFDLPTGYRLLADVGITDDYSMGYGSINGFRASVASSFYWYDLQKNERSLLRVHPFCFMEANSFYEQKYSALEAYQELVDYYSVCRKVGGRMITIWHNNFLGTEVSLNGWSDIYQRFILLLRADYQ